MGMREFELPAPKLPGTRVAVDTDGKPIIEDGQHKIVPVMLGLADLILNNVLSQPDLMASQEGCDLILSLNPKLAPLRGEGGAGKKVQVSESQWEELKKRLPRVFPNGVPPESQLAVAEAFRAVHTAKVVTEAS